MSTLLSVAKLRFRGGISFPRINTRLLTLALWICDNQRFPISRDDFDLQLVIFAILCRVRRRKADSVLASKECGDTPKNVWDLSFKPGEPGCSPGHFGKTIEYVFRMQVAERRTARNLRLIFGFGDTH